MHENQVADDLIFIKNLKNYCQQRNPNKKTKKNFSGCKRKIYCKNFSSDKKNFFSPSPSETFINRIKRRGKPESIKFFQLRKRGKV